MTRIGAEDPASLEIRRQPLEHDYVRRDQQKRFCEIVAGLRDRVEKLPRDGKGHHLRLPAAGSHFDAVASKIVVLEQTQIASDGESFH